MTIKMFTASIDEFDPIPAIEHWNVAGVRWPQNENWRRKYIIRRQSQWLCCKWVEWLLGNYFPDGFKKLRFQYFFFSFSFRTSRNASGLVYFL